MRLRSIIAVLTLLLVLAAGPALPAGAWGPTGHRLIARYAVGLTPEPLRTLLQAHLEELEAAALAPDERKSDPAFGDESHKHYIDIDAFAPYPFRDFPHSWEEAVAQYGTSLTAQGTLPWAIAESFHQLARTWARDDPTWLRWAGDLSHYVADLHQPFHTTANFDGQKTGNRGIHALFEDVMVDTFWDDAYFRPSTPGVSLGWLVGVGALGGATGFWLGGPLGAALGAALGAGGLWLWTASQPALRPVDDPLETAFQIIPDSYAQIEPLLRAHDAAQQYRQTDPKFYETFWQAGAQAVMTRQINRAAVALARYWTGAWLAAGRPSF